MNIKQLKAFTQVASSLSFVEAAAKLHLSQPALSLSIKNLEESLGGKLLTRTTRTLVLTQEGKAFLPVAKNLLNQIDAAEQEMKKRFALDLGHTSIAAMPSFASSILPKIIKRFHTKYPNIKLSVDDVLSDTVIDLVNADLVELGISFEPKHNGDLVFHPLYNDQFIVVLPQFHPLAKCHSISWSELLKFELITLQSPSSVRGLIEDTLSQHNIALNPAFDAHQLATVIRMVSNDLGVAVVPALCKEQALEAGVICREINKNKIARRVGVISKPITSLSIAAKSMLETIKLYSLELRD